VTVEQRNALWASLGVLAVTIVFVAITLVVGRAEPVDIPPELTVGRPSPERFVADRSTLEPITDEAATQIAQQEARDEVALQFTRDTEAEVATKDDIARFYRDLAEVAIVETAIPEPEPEPQPEPEPTDTTQAGGEEDPTESTTSTEPPTTTTTTMPRRSFEEQAELLSQQWPELFATTVESFVRLYNNDLDRITEGLASVFPAIEMETIAQAESEFDRGIRQNELQDLARDYLNSPPSIFVTGLPPEEQVDARAAISELLARTLRANELADNDATEAAREAAAAAVPVATTVYRAFDTIVEQGDILTQVHVDAITQLGLFDPVEQSVPSRLAMALVGAIAVLLTAFFLWRLSPKQWSEPKHFVLLGLLLLLSAIISRIPELLVDDGSHPLGYLMPVVAIGFMAAILFDPRTAVLLAVPMAAFTAVSTNDVAFIVYAGVATVIPVAFVSSVASRRQLRLAVVSSAAAVAPVAGALEWLFQSADAADVLRAAGWAALGALVAGFIAQGLVSFLETSLGITTSLSLLDLLDRNHPALRLLEEKAPGTFNHSMLVGSLAGRAARAIGADPLLAQAAAWYHDLGKTEDPQYYVENQFGVSNPHDELPPARSAEIIRGHVTKGLRLARQFRIPSGVADGIRMHHGTSLMRFFYNKAHAEDPTVDPALFRHHGLEPRQKEMAIVMLSDAVEAAARSYAQHEDPTAQGLVELVDSIVQEKVDDHQLAYSAITFGDLTLVKTELVRALMGYYHTRVPYPGFPGPQVTRGLPAGRPSLPEPVAEYEDDENGEGGPGDDDTEDDRAGEPVFEASE
jgi:cyclic-di-AMP phosphodiesterase PgpH